jgi:sugar-specific transcriptional regulator TrmB
MSEDESISQLRTLGLNLYESRAYLALIKARELTAKGVGLSAMIPQSRTYDVLESLSRKGFALETPGSPATYLPVPPGKILGTLYSAERKKIQEGALKAAEEAQARLERLQDAYSALTKNYPAKAGVESAVRDRVWVLQTRENIERTLIEFIKESKTAVLRITKPPELSSGEPLDPFYIVGLENRRYLYDALERKVEMRWLSLAREIPMFSGLEVGEPPERRYIEDERDITEKFLLVDNHSVLLNLHDPASSTYGSVALAMQSRAAASIFLDHFEKVWQKGRPLDEILPRMKQLVKDVSAKLREIGFGKIDVVFYQTLARLGAVSRETVVSELTKRSVSSQDSTSSCDKLMRLGLVHRDNTYRLLVAEHPSIVGAAIASGKLRPPQAGRVTTRKSSSGKNL